MEDGRVWGVMRAEAPSSEARGWVWVWVWGRAGSVETLGLLGTATLVNTGEM